MPDEALTRYTSVIDQLTEGHLWLKENLDTIPENAWVNDPFGFSSTMPYLWKSSGMDNLVILRIHQAIKATLMKQRSLEFMWRPYWKTDSAHDVLTNIMPYPNYWANDVCGPDQKICKLFNFLHMQDDPASVSHITEENIEHVATEMYKAYKFTAGIYEYNNLVIFLGEDNSYSQEDAWENTYHNYKKLMEFINNKPEWKMKIKFGTIKEYFANIRKQETGKHKANNGLNLHPKFPTLSGDFFPYSDRENAYWTGFYTTRPWVKKLAREIEPVLKAADAFTAILYHRCILQKMCTGIHEELVQILDNLKAARRELGIYQHHDGITGTSLPYVVFDYEMRLMSALEKSQEALKSALVTLLTKGKSSNHKRLEENFEKLDSKSIHADRLHRMTNGGLVIIIANPLDRPRSEIVNILVDRANVAVWIGNKTVSFQISQISQNSNVLIIKGYLVSFRIKMDPYEILQATLQETNTQQKVYKSELFKGRNKIYLEAKKLTVEFDPSTCSIQKITNNKGRETAVKSGFMQYKPQTSGPYLFGPAGPAEEIPDLYKNLNVYLLKGPLISEIDCLFASGFSQRFRLYNTSGVQGQGLHMSNIVDLEKGFPATTDVEVILRLQTDIQNENILFTDQNSFQLMGRKTYPDRLIESNFYPISSMAILEDENKRLTLHSAQPNGVASLESGWLEVMLDRNMEADDGRGLGSGVYDRVKTLSEFILQVEYKSTVSSLEEERYSHPTLYNIILSDLFQYPLQTFVDLNQQLNDIPNPKTGSLTFQPYLGSRESQLPCDTTLSNLRLLQTNDLKVIGTSVVLHRRPIHCLYTRYLKRCETHTGIISARDMLKLLGIDSDGNDNVKVLETSLSHLHVKRIVSHNANLRPDRNELKSYLIKNNEM